MIQINQKVNIHHRNFQNSLSSNAFTISFELVLSDQQDDLSMFSVEEGDTKDVYPDVENALDCFNTGDALQQRNRGENNCNYDWADDIDVLNVLHSVNDWPVLQVPFFFHTNFHSNIDLETF